jgi:hypothetical protein
MLAIMLATFTAILLYASRRAARVNGTLWSLMGLFYVVLGVMTYINDAVLQYNVSAGPIPVAGVAGVLLATIVVFIVIFLRSRRGVALTPAGSISEEKHASPLMALICLVPAVVMFTIVSSVPTTGLKATLLAAALVVLGCAAMAWDGFHYLFSPAGVEIRTLGFRLRSIPANAIQSYAVDKWGALGGYGIRGVGDTRAYVWSKTGVRIKTTEGEVFLGHTEPGRIIHDLDLLTHAHDKRS